jgi:hypothetical protein
MTMDKDGNVTITSLKFNFETSDHIQSSSKKHRYRLRGMAEIIIRQFFVFPSGTFGFAL